MKDNKGQVTIPTDLNIVKETLEVAQKWGADAFRDCDGTEFPAQLIDSGKRIYKTYYTTRKDNSWALSHPEERQQIYIMSSAKVATEKQLIISLMEGISPKMVEINPQEKERWWEVIDRTTNEIITNWTYNEKDKTVSLEAIPYHAYTVSFLAFMIWDPVNMYNSITNSWKLEPQITFDVRQPLTHAYSLERLKKFIVEHPYVDVIRFTTFFHLFTLIFDDKAREKYVDWFGYSASVSPYILNKFEKEVGYPFRAEYIVDSGYYNNQYRVPSKQYKDFMAFQRKEVCALVREFTDLCHEYGKEAMMFLGDHHIGVEPFMDEFKNTGIDSIVGSVGNGSTLRLISDIKGVKYTEGRFLPYFFPDTFHEGGNPVKEAKENWVTARRAILRKPIDRIGYGGYLSLALKFPDFMDYIQSVCDEFRILYQNVKGTTGYCFKKVAILNCWGKMRSWGAHMVHHALYQKQNYSYAGVLEILSGAPYDVVFISFDELLENSNLLDNIDLIINVGDADTAHTGGDIWENPIVAERLRAFVYNGGGFIGIGEPTAHQWQGHFIQLFDVLGVEKETGFTLGYDKYNWQPQPHFITEEIREAAANVTNVADNTADSAASNTAVNTTANADANEDFVYNWGEGKKSIYALEGAQIIALRDKEVQGAVNECGKGRGVYLSGLPYSAENTRLLHRAILWATHSEHLLHSWFSTNPNTELNAYPANNKFCVVNNTSEVQKTTVYTAKTNDSANTANDNSFELTLQPNEIKWYSIE